MVISLFLKTTEVMKNTASDSIMNKLANPFRQAAIVLVLTLVSDIFWGFANSAGAEMRQNTPWVIGATFILFFAMFNAILSVTTKNMDRYWTRSMISYIAVAGVGGLLAWAFSSLSINEAGTFRWLYIVLTLGYLLFLSMMRAMRKIVEFAQREEWNQPKIRKRRKG